MRLIDLSNIHTHLRPSSLNDLLSTGERDSLLFMTHPCSAVIVKVGWWYFKNENIYVWLCWRERGCSLHQNVLKIQKKKNTQYLLQVIYQNQGKRTEWWCFQWQIKLYCVPVPVFYAHRRNVRLKSYAAVSSASACLVFLFDGRMWWTVHDTGNSTPSHHRAAPKISHHCQ